MKKLKDADLLLWVGPNLEPYLSNTVLSLKNSIAMSEIEDISWLSMESKNNSGLHSDIVAHNHSGVHDPHIWLDLNNVSFLAEKIISQLTLQMPHEGEGLQLKLRVFLEQLLHLKSKTEDRLNGVGGPFYVYHNGFGYFVNTYTLDQRAALMSSPELKPGARHLAELKNNAQGVACLLADRDEKYTAKRYAKMFNLPLIEADLLAREKSLSTYSEYYLKLGEAFRKCLNNL